MEETLGKRISRNRKQLGLTQDQLAEKLGVTAQAVSKWENDQSCPDIQTLPRLAAIFGITTDALLGVAAESSTPEKRTLEAEVVPEKEIRIPITGGRRLTLGLALWLLLAGGLLLLCRYFTWDNSTWTVLWSTGLLIFGLMGLWPEFSVFRLGCAIAAGLSLALMFTGRVIGWPVCLLILGGLLLLAVFRGKKQKTIHVPVNGSLGSSGCTMEGERFESNVSFGEKHYRIALPRLSAGRSALSFGEVELDLTGCGEIAEGCHLDLSTSFGETSVILPRSCRVKPEVKTAFGAFEIQGSPEESARTTVLVTGSVSFGQMDICYR